MLSIVYITILYPITLPLLNSIFVPTRSYVISLPFENSFMVNVQCTPYVVIIGLYNPQHYTGIYSVAQHSHTHNPYSSIETLPSSLHHT